MNHRCPRCTLMLRDIDARNLWTVHKVCLRCKIVFVCWDSIVTRCQTPALCCPDFWCFVQAVSLPTWAVIPGPDSRGLV
jgi:hypothetical protein